ncbi:related to ALG12 - alpha-1,6-mannosyltransferase [Melanopsichium pennsylvanicum]|uniref:Mannosyltransferase n=2 Tax=Melanopsichium pennsylvanicum TaxID=63383 RepID=A0AAJ4XGL0_9BASI|nr:related to ALG12-alpha-1,6-mannosyltransferase [Melanopsichium pennsylvanicum 4]SNX81655.1 related to ALG12 - alpha-1,6-mannosyltransferase [Melanopsichium pennsylvanicum]
MHRIRKIIWLFGLPCLFVLVSWRAVSCPYTKVEESFTIQAVHDILIFGVSPDALAQYDHQVFPGAVPRSFIGPLLLATVSYPFILISQTLGAVNTSADAQIAVRICLGTINVMAVAFFAQQCFVTTATAKKQAGSITRGSNVVLAGLFLLITAAQFHFAYWASRTIPNSLALPFVITAMTLVCRSIGNVSKGSQSILGDVRAAIWLLTFSTIVLRLEIVATLIPVGLYLLSTGKINFWNAFKTGAISGTMSVMLTAVVDTYFWQDLAHSRANDILGAFVTGLHNLATGQKPFLLWPELHALLFNVIEGKSSEWGVSPWHAYATSLVPKLLAFTSPLILFGVAAIVRGERSVVEARARFLLLTAVTHIAILSMLGHKEWRFVFYILPALNVVAAIGAGALLRSWLAKTILIALILLQVLLSLFTGYLSSINYPGGEAIKLLHEQLGSASGSQGRVHIDVLPAMTGVTLFQSLHLERTRSQGLVDRFAGLLPTTCEKDDCWIYDKTEDLPTSGPEAAQAWSSFTHILTDAPYCHVLRSRERGEALADSRQLFEPITEPIKSFSGLRRKNFSQIKGDYIGLAKTIMQLPNDCDLNHLMRLVLPVVIVEEPAVWLCRRKDHIA